jgi:hypothetical protein
MRFGAKVPLGPEIYRCRAGKWESRNTGVYRVAPPMSTPNKRTVVYLPPLLEQWVEQEAQKNYESVCAVIRRAIVNEKARQEKQ